MQQVLERAPGRKKSAEHGPKGPKFHMEAVEAQASSETPLSRVRNRRKSATPSAAAVGVGAPCEARRPPARRAETSKSPTPVDSECETR
eukprot:11081844-Alexandrium_andersonii.AAC.1